MKTSIIYYIKLTLVFLAFVILLFHIQDSLSLVVVPIILLYLILGFWFGKITCSIHSKNKGFWVTSSLFVFLNFFHSLIDGVTLTNLSAVYKNIAIYSHELLRQPALYIIFWSMLQPFTKNNTTKAVVALVSITGVWMIGMYTGTMLGNSLQELHINGIFFELSIFIFIGDIIHHLYDEFPGRKHVH